MIRAAHAVRQRPLTSFAIGSSTTLLGYGAFLEHQANQIELAHQGNPDPSLATVATLPRVYDWQALTDYWSHRPLSTAYRLGQISYHVLPRAMAYLRDFYLGTKQDNDDALQHQHAAQWREALTRLGPAFVKAGQQLSIRPDLVPPAVLAELQKLCDAVEPVSNDIAMRVLQDELDVENIDTVFSDLQLVASASLGQVYKGKLRSTGQEVAVKVQKPDTRRSFSLDLYLLQHLGVAVDLFTAIFTNQPPFHKPLYESFAAGSYAELDYEQEAANQLRFQAELRQRKSPVVIPEVHTACTTERVITTQWIDGIKLADAPKERRE